jgi:Extended Signal Peptide of Type V secretion system
MNKNLYRIIFNIARGTWIAVAEIIRSRGKLSSPATGPACCPNTAYSHAMRRLSFSIMLAVGTASITAPQAHAEIVADANAHGSLQPDVTNTPSGIP